MWLKDFSRHLAFGKIVIIISWFKSNVHNGKKFILLFLLTFFVFQRGFPLIGKILKSTVFVAYFAPDLKANI